MDRYTSMIMNFIIIKLLRVLLGIILSSWHVGLWISIWTARAITLYTLKRDSSPKDENYVIIYSPSCHSKLIRLSFIFKTQMKIFFLRDFCPSIRSPFHQNFDTWTEVGRVLKNCTQVKVKVLLEIFTQVKVKVIIWIVTWVRVKSIG